MKGVRKEARVAVTRAARWLTARSAVITYLSRCLIILASVYICRHSIVTHHHPFHLLLVAGNDLSSSPIALHSLQL
jgi:hypothetical protein